MKTPLTIEPGLITELGYAVAKTPTQPDGSFWVVNLKNRWTVTADGFDCYPSVMIADESAAPDLLKLKARTQLEPTAIPVSWLDLLRMAHEFANVEIRHHSTRTGHELNAKVSPDFDTDSTWLSEWLIAYAFPKLAPMDHKGRATAVDMMLSDNGRSPTWTQPNY